MHIERLRLGALPVHEPGLGGLISEGLGNGRLLFAFEYDAIEGAALRPVG